MEQKIDSENSPSPTLKKKSVSAEDFTIKHKLGKGAYGDVFLVVKNSDEKVYAMKQIQKKKLERERKEYQALVEKELLSNFKHPGIIKLRYAFQDKKTLNFILEYCQGGQFIQFIKLNIAKLTQTLKVFYIAQIANLIEYIHKSGVTHRDLKPENLMLDSQGNLKLIDFGTAEITNCNIISQQFKDKINELKNKEQTEEKPTEEASEEESMSPKGKNRRSTFVGTCYYISPQLLQQNYCPPSADLWALGCIIYQLYYLETPFKDTYEYAVFEKIKKAEVHFPKNDHITENAIDLIKRLIVKDPNERLGCGSTEALSFNSLKKHPFFEGVDIDNIFNLPVPEFSQLNIHKREEGQQKTIKLQPV